MKIAQSNPLLLLIISTVCFIIGFIIVSKLIDYFKNKPKQDERMSNSSNAESRNEYENKEERLNPEIKYRSIFGFVGPYSKDDVKKRYRELMSKYHPDKVQHLGKEFQIIAEEKTRMIHEAYQYFRETYNIKD